MTNRFNAASFIGCLIAISYSPTILAQQQKSRVEFEVAAIRRAKSGAQGNFIEIAPGGERFTATNSPLKLLIMMAYGVADWKITSGPNWVNSECFDIEAKPERPTSRDQIFEMLRNLLSDRFGLRLHSETRKAEGYVLIAPEKPFGLRENRSGDRFMVKRDESGQVVFRSFPMAQLAWFLSVRLHRDVVDKTGLTESYDFELAYAPDVPSLTGSFGGLPADGTDRPSLQDALLDQLGLRLQLEQGTAEVLIIDAVLKPSEN